MLGLPASTVPILPHPAPLATDRPPYRIYRSRRPAPDCRASSTKAMGGPYAVVPICSGVGRCLHPSDVRPNPALGDFYYVPMHHRGLRTTSRPDMLAAFRFPPSCHADPKAPSDCQVYRPVYLPGSYVGPVIGVDHAPHCTAVLDGPYWVVIWVAHLERNPADPWVPIRRGLHILRPVSWQQVREARLTSASPDGPTTLRWHHQFLDLWDYSGQLGMHHVTLPQADTPPRFLLSGQA